VPSGIGIEAAAPVVLSFEVWSFPLYAFNASPTRPRVRRGELILSRGAIVAGRHISRWSGTGSRAHWLGEVVE
jgi:hypothetical protein